MELRAGYKQTEVGVIPEDWKVELIRNHCSIKTGDKNTQDKIGDGIFPFFVRSQKVERINSYSFEGEAVLTAGDGVGTGKIFHYINGKFDYHQRVYKMSNFSDHLDGYYFYLYFSSHFYDRISQMTAKSSVDSVRLEMIAEMPMALPPTKAEQEAIAKALSDMDALIQSLEQQIIKKQQIKQGTMQTLLSPYDRNGALKQGWSLKEYKNIAPLQRGFDLPNSQVKKGKYPVVYSNGVLKHHHKFMAEGPGVVTGRSGTLGVVHYIENNYWPHNTTLWVTNFHGNCPKFIFYLLQSINLNRFGTGSGVPTLNRADVHTHKVYFPEDVREQEEIASTLTNIDSELRELQSKLSKHKQLKQGMMQNLLTGSIRLV